MSVKENGERENVESSTKKAVNRSMERRGREGGGGGRKVDRIRGKDCREEE